MKKLGRGAPLPYGWGLADPLCPSPIRVNPAKIGRSVSKGTSALNEIRLKNLTPCPAFQGHSRSSEQTRIDPPPYDFILTFQSNHGPISHCFRDKRRFQSKIANFFQRRVFNAPAEWVPLGTGYHPNNRWPQEVQGAPIKSIPVQYLADNSSTV